MIKLKETKVTNVTKQRKRKRNRERVNNQRNIKRETNTNSKFLTY